MFILIRTNKKKIYQKKKNILIEPSSLPTANTSPLPSNEIPFDGCGPTLI
jgi:hypothetical protein